MVPAAARSPLRAVMKRTERREPDGRIFAGSLPAARVVAVAQQFFSTTMTASTQQVVERYILIEAAGVRGQGEEAARASVQQLTECHEESLPGTEAFLLGQEGNSGVGFIARYDFWGSSGKEEPERLPPRHVSDKNPEKFVLIAIKLSRIRKDRKFGMRLIVH
ncbi:uncharacterized protein [Lolium perenne]|uniref:uncharacterized protein isoform X4 n=1 Tax=Lolium perenne TaxID=4522 RepID=UPI003A98F71A